MTVLGIETSCDETASAVCRDGTIVSSVIARQVVHGQYGGVVPEIASREHEKYLTSVVVETLRRAKIRRDEIEAVAVTRGPGLMGALLTGVSFSRGFAQGLNIPCFGINHMEAHIFANFIAYPELKYPFLCLLVSGGHTQIWKVMGMGDYDLLGETRDDAAGEAFDKGARILGLGFPGGPALEKAAEGGDETAVDFPKAFIKSEAIEYSFSGLKTALLYFTKKAGGPVTERTLADVAASYQKAIIDILLFKLKQAVNFTGVRTAVIAGGVAANERLRSRAKEILEHIEVLYPPAFLCTDNAAMVAFLGERYLSREGHKPTDLSVVPNLGLVD